MSAFMGITPRCKMLHQTWLFVLAYNRTEYMLFPFCTQPLLKTKQKQNLIFYLVPTRTENASLFFDGIAGGFFLNGTCKDVERLLIAQDHKGIASGCIKRLYRYVRIRNAINCF